MTGSCWTLRLTASCGAEHFCKDDSEVADENFLPQLAGVQNPGKNGAGNISPAHLLAEGHLWNESNVSEAVGEVHHKTAAS